MSQKHKIIQTGYLDVKISTKVKRGFTPWKAWRRQWCEICNPNSSENGLRIKMSNSIESNHSNVVFLPKNAMICRTESRSQQFAFGIFGTDRDHKPLLFLSGATESDSQSWMYSIRTLLSLSPQAPVSDGSFYVSLVDNIHSRSANITGIHGFLYSDAHGITVRNPCTKESIVTLQWYQFHQFHLAATGSLEDERRIIVMHTSKEFPGGAGQMHFFCLEAPRLLETLVARGKSHTSKQNFSRWRRFSRSEGDLRDMHLVQVDTPTSPVHLRSHSGSDDSGVRVSMASDDSSLVLKCKMAMNYLSVGFTGLVGATPGGSEVDNESLHDLLDHIEDTSFVDEMHFLKSHPDPRRESGVSVLSGVYEEISEVPPPPKEFQNHGRTAYHFYEDPVDILLGSSHQDSLTFLPPPLPPRQDTLTKISATGSDFDLLNISQAPEITITQSQDEAGNSSSDILKDLLCDSLYTTMGSEKSQAESHYVPMFPVKDLSADENPYLVMTGKEK